MPRHWTVQENQLFERALYEGHGYEWIAQQTGRTYTAVIIHAKRNKMVLKTHKRGLYAQEIARLLGVSCVKTVIKWIQKRGLRAVNYGSKGKTLYGVSLLDLYAWLEDEKNWMCYDPERCTDPSLREHLREIRVGKPKWLRIGEVAKRLMVESRTVNKWIIAGELAAEDYGNWWIREDVLERFSPPWQRSKKGMRVPRFENREQLIEHARRLRSNGHYLHIIAEVLGISISTVHRFTRNIPEDIRS